MVGVPHEYALKLIMENFGDWANTTTTKPNPGIKNYTGGEISLLILHHYMPIYLNYIIFKLDSKPRTFR